MDLDIIPMTRTTPNTAEGSGHAAHFHFDPGLCLQAEEAAQGFAALGSPARLQVLASLVKAGPQGLSVGEIEARCAIKGSTLAHHLRALVGAGLAEQHKQGRSVLTSASYPQLEALAGYILHECCAEQQDPKAQYRDGANQKENAQ